MYRVLLFASYTWGPGADYFDTDEEALAQVKGAPTPWRIQEWIDVRNGPAGASFWRDIRYWIDGVGGLA